MVGVLNCVTTQLVHLHVLAKKDIYWIKTTGPVMVRISSQ